MKSLMSLIQVVLTSVVFFCSSSVDPEAAQGTATPIREDVTSLKCDFRHFVLTMARFQRFTHHKQSAHPLSTDDKKIECE